MSTWPETTAHVAAAVQGAVATGPRISRRQLVIWARREARVHADVLRLTHRAAREIDAIVDQALAVSTRT